jgi:hypothetical protein
MSVRRSNRRIDRLKEARSRASRYVVGTKSKSGKFQVRRSAGRAFPKARTNGGAASNAETRGKDYQQPRPKVPLLSGGKDPTLGERFEEELYRS